MEGLLAAAMQQQPLNPRKGKEIDEGKSEEAETRDRDRDGDERTEDEQELESDPDEDKSQDEEVCLSAALLAI